MVKEPKISIIIPVYNTEKYLHRCLDSIINQSYKDLEVIVVNDCSPGEVEQIVKEYIKKDARIKYVKHEKNRGLFRARLTGAELATGDYIAFLDSDDYVTLDYYHCLVKKAIEKNADIVIGKTVLEKTDGSREIQNFHDSCFEFEELVGREIKQKYFEQKGLCYSWHTIWNKIYKKELWNKCFPYYDTIQEHLIMTEDIAFSTLLFYKAEKVATIKNEAYFYCENKDASTNIDEIKIERFEKNIKDITLAFNFVQSFLDEVDAEKDIRENFQEFRKYYSRLWRELGENVFSGQDKKHAIKLMDEFLCDYVEYTTSDDHFFENVKTKWNGGLEYIKERILTSKQEYISFDIFDTVVTRPLYNPTDLFILLDKKFEKLIKTNISFSKIRIQAENNARYQLAYTHPGYQDVTIDEIYSYIEKDFELPATVVSEMLEEEKRLEIELCTQRRATKEIYDLALLCGKKVIFTSDMYLDETTIKIILNKNGYTGYQKLYLSSSERLTKSSGDLFKVVLKDLNTTGDNILHIGDTWQNDIVNAQTVGIEAIFLPKAIEVFENKINGINTNECGSKFYRAMSNIHNAEQVMQSLGFRSMIAIIANRYFDNPYRTFNERSDFNIDSYFMGYYSLGMHLIGVSSWLMKQGQALGYKNIGFMARDGYLPMKAYKEYSKLFTDVPKEKYIYASRKSVLPAMIKTKEDFYDLPIELRNHTCETLLDLLEFCSKNEDRELMVKNLKQHGIIYNKNFNNDYEFNHFIKYYLENIYDEEKHKIAFETASKYFKQIIGSEDATFDLGYSGRIQGAIAQLVGHPIDVFFIHQDSKRADTVKRKEKFNVQSFYDFTPYMTGLIREHLVSDPGPSCIGFKIVEGEIHPVLEKEEKKYQDLFIIQLIHRGALDFIKDYVNKLGEYSEYLGFRSQELSLPYEGMLREMKEMDAHIFKASYFEDLIYGAKDSINIYDFIQGQYSSLPLCNRESSINNYIDHSTMVNNILINRNKFTKIITYAVFDRKTLKEKVKRRLVNHPRVLISFKYGYKVLKRTMGR